ncbi:trafficking protein particle complex subunit 10 [Abortiporus biennis]|nr:trafficking protein particle complex subunit 10 [Abortiporus biennis]
MSRQKVTITYNAPPSFISSEHWRQVYAAFLSQLPLRNLHWKPASRPTLRTIQELDINLVYAETLRDEHTSQIPQTVLEKPLLSAYFVVCDDADTYKNTVRKQIKDWHTAVTQRKNTEWLIVHIIRPESRTTGGRIFQIKTSVLDKIKADFNVDKRDRCVQLIWSYDDDNPTAWADLMNKLKEGILSSFDIAITQKEEEVRRSEGQRQMPGWNFCTFFILKESLANSFEGMNLHEDALESYNELEALFSHVSRDRNLSWFGSFISPGPKDDALPLLASDKKPYRDMILGNTISVFDFRIYLLSRQCSLLSSLGKIVEIAQKSATFLRIYGKRVRELEGSLPPFFIECWSYGSALSVVEQCDIWASGKEMDKTTLANFNAAKGELVELARHQLDIIGIKLGHLPAQPPFSIALPSKPSSRDRRRTKLPKPEIMDTFEDKDKFIELYLSCTRRAIELFASAGRRKFALKMHGSLAALEVHLGNLDNALQTFASLPAHYAPHGWTSLEAYMLIQALDIHASANKPQDVEWIHVLVQFLKAYVEDFGKELLMTREDIVTYLNRLLVTLKEAAEAVEDDVKQLDHPAFVLSVPNGDARTAETRDGSLLDVVITNKVPSTVPIDEVLVHVTGRDNTRLTFSETVASLEPGENVITLFCHSATAGVYALHSSQVRIAKLNFHWSHAPNTSNKAPRLKKAPTLVRIPKDIRSLDVKLRQPERIELGTPPRLVAAFASGRNFVVKATVKLSAPSGVLFTMKDAVVVGEEKATLETAEDQLTLSNVEPGKTILIAVPHSDASAYNAIRVDILVDYVTQVEPDVERSLKLQRIGITSLPLTVNVEDFFRGTRLFTRFTLSTPPNSHQHVRIRSTELLSPNANDDLNIKKSVNRTSSVVTVTPIRPGRFVFQLDSGRSKEREPLSLQITYRTLREEVQHLVESSAAEIVPTSDPILRDTLIDKAVHALESDPSWVDLYEVTGEVVLPNIPLPDQESEKPLVDALSQLKDILNQSRRTEQVVKQWREIVIPVDVPQMHIIAAARLRILANPFTDDEFVDRSFPLFAGQPISALLTITTSFHWAPAEDAHVDAYTMRYDVEEMTKDWLVSGRKRGEFIGKHGETFSTPVTLIAMRHGELSLPKIAVGALAVPGEKRMMQSSIVPNCEQYQVHGAETVLVLPRGGRNTFVVSMGENLLA